ncbi:galactokinase [Aeromicrobium sp. YIM 150415]|uniref:galactokinase n=1 Tax=Aeromicrobium sp. YIM 150415 TaxID=2803912 RepID=UPI001965A145|nr:galactokinase [Aeromicrobium sp. YIM 150415]MBM9462122.1 galactokinase [Aeromicrobium sp. YIM 150415]
MNEVREWTVPGRVNLIGEHLDYNGGAVLPIAIDRGLLIKVRMRDDGAVNVWSGGRKASFGVDIAPGEVDDWALYTAAAVWATREAEVPVPGADIVIESTLPTGAGLSSSAALTCGLAAALDDFAGTGFSRLDLARIGQRAESDFVGAPVGLMDQLAVLCGEAGHALHIDFADDDAPALASVPATWSDHGLVLAVIDTGITHALASGEYAARRRECDEAASQLGLSALARAQVDAVLRLDDDTLKRRTRHVVTESARVRGTVKALGSGEWKQLGTILSSSHESLRDDFEVSCPELDIAVEEALEAGALGARMTGGGFGGSAIALLPSGEVENLRSRVEAQYTRRDWKPPQVFTVSPVDGASRRT